MTAPVAPQEGNIRPELAAEQINAELAKLNQATESSRYRPTVNLQGYLGTQGFNPNFGQALDPSQWYGNSYIALQIALPIFNGFDTDSRIQKERLREQQAQFRQSELKRQFEYEAGQALNTLNQAWKILQVRIENLIVAQESLRLVGLRKSEGRALPREILDADAKLAQVQEQELQAYFDYLNARLDYEKATGQINH
jgi:outer membrane protein TolC